MRYLLIPLLFISGCWTSNRQEQEVSQETREHVGIDRGQPTQLTETITKRTTTESQAQSGVDLGKMLAAGMAVLEGKMMSAIAAMKPADPPKPNGLDGTTAGLGLAAAGLGINALRDYLAKKALAKDRDEGWQKAQEAHQREVELAKQLPPPVQA